MSVASLRRAALTSPIPAVCAPPRTLVGYEGFSGRVTVSVKILHVVIQIFYYRVGVSTSILALPS